MLIQEAKLRSAPRKMREAVESPNFIIGEVKSVELVAGGAEALDHWYAIAAQVQLTLLRRISPLCSTSHHIRS